LHRNPGAKRAAVASQLSALSPQFQVPSRLEAEQRFPHRIAEDHERASHEELRAVTDLKPRISLPRI